MPDDVLAARLLAIFVEELGEQVQELNDHLLALERAPGGVEQLLGVFRVMHTLKGAARAAGVREIENLCHVLETDLARARDTGTPLSGAGIALLFEAADALSDARERLAAGNTVADGPLAMVLQHARARGDLTPAAAVPPAVKPKDRAPLAPPVPAQAPGETPAVALTVDTVRDEQVRVGLHHVDAISNAAGEVTSLAGLVSDRATDLAALRQRVRGQRALAEHRDDAELAAMDREITRLMRRVGEDARGLGSVSGRLTATARRLRQRALRDLTEILPRVLRDVAHDVGKQAHLVVTGEDIEADRIVVEALRDPLLHLIRNAIDHGLEATAERRAAGKPEQGTVSVAATLRGDRLRLTIADDGRGLDLEAIRRALVQRGRRVPGDSAALRRSIFDEGFSTREQATTLSGRGVGLGIVRAAVERVGGTVDVDSVQGQGTTFVLEVPLSIATLRVLTVQVDGARFGIPSAFVSRVDRVKITRIAKVDGRAMLTGSGAPAPVVTLAALLGPPFIEPAVSDTLQIVTLETGGRRLCVVVDELNDERELVLRPLEHAGGAATAITVGTALLGDGEVVLVLGVAALMGDASAAESFAIPVPARDQPASRRVLVVDDSITSRTLEQSVLAAAGYDVITAVNGVEAWHAVEQGGIALVVSDVEMPHLDGIGLCERIRASQRHAQLPVILVTSLDEPAQRARGLEAGADAYITKSGFDQDVLLDTVRQLLGAPRSAAR